MTQNRTEMNLNSNHESERAPELERMKQLLKAAVPRIAADAEPGRDLWPDVLRRIDREPVKVPWFDWALAGGLVMLAAAFPSVIPVFLYYL
ncbi:MAG TPA: hypothetical protein VL986_07055 [Terracidiphilus sp.]|nr:hypothetical protein [Terracidiphilus sp.]